jgi:predicted O-methyltransferase YrrM
MNTSESRAQVVRNVPRVNLEAKHVEGSSIVESRLAMLGCLPKGKRCLELGVASGGFSQEIWRRLRPASLDLVDMWAGERYAPGYEQVLKIFEHQVAAGQVRVHRSSSVNYLHAQAPQSFDFIYIDTDHSYSTTYAELCASAKLISPGGYIAGHDYTVGNIVTPVVYGVIAAVNKFCLDQDFRLQYLTAESAGWNSFCLTRL